MHKISIQKGFSLLEFAFVLFLMALLAFIAIPAYSNHVREAKLRAAQKAMLLNAQAMERFYQQKGKFRKTSTTWPTLPVKGTEDFCIRLHGKANEKSDDYKFTLKAVAYDKDNEPRILKMNETLVTFICEKSGNTCGDKGSEFTGQNVDKDCRIYQN